MEVRLTDAVAAASAHSPSVAKADASHAAGSEAQAQAAPGFISPVIRVEAAVGVAVLMVRNGDTGEVVAQYPAKKVVEEYSSHSHSDAPLGAGSRPIEAAVAAEQSAEGGDVSASASTSSPSPAPSVDSESA